MNKYFILLCLLASLSLSSCALQLGKEIDNDSGPDQISEFKVPNPIPQPNSGKGSVIGQIVTNNSQDMVGLIIYLGELIEMPENMFGAYLDTKTAPSSLISFEDGKFFIKDVEPGKYALIIYEVVMGGRVYQDSNGAAIPIEVTNGEITDVGKIEVNLSEIE